MSDNSNNVHFEGVRFVRADNGKMRAANESYALKMNIIVILKFQDEHATVFEEDQL